MAAIAHPDGSNENDIGFTISYQAQDSNGDTAQGSVDITINDDMPNPVDTAIATDDNNLGTTVNGTLDANIGSDFTGASYTLIAPSDDVANSISYSLDSNTNTLTVSQNGSVVMTVAVNTATGGYAVTQTGVIEHPQGQNSLALNINYQVTDGDNDSVQGTCRLRASDDVPY